MLDLILGKHLMQLQVDLPTDAQPTESNCARCHGTNHWQTHGNPVWYYQACDPPPTESMVAQRTGAPTIRMTVAYAVGRHARAVASVCGNCIEFTTYRTRPVCDCGSHMVVENTWSDGVATFECASCAAGIAADKITERIGDRHG